MNKEESIKKLKSLKNADNPVLDKHLEFMIDALYDVKACYISEYDIREEVVKQHLERVFAYEFYYHWHKKLGDDEYGPKINAEIHKKYDGWSHGYIMPDMVLHGGQDSGYNQLIACEIKRHGCNRDDMIEDIVRLYKMTTSEEYNYKVGIFIYVANDNSHMEKTFKNGILGIKDNICNLFNATLEELNTRGNVILIAYNGYQCQLYSFKDLLNKYHNQ